MKLHMVGTANRRTRKQRTAEPLFQSFFFDQPGRFGVQPLDRTLNLDITAVVTNQSSIFNFPIKRDLGFAAAGLTGLDRV